MFEPEDVDSASDALREGWLIDGRYQIVALLESGAKAKVYKVLDRCTNLVCAARVLKLNSKEEPILARMLERELHKWRELNHSNIITTYDIGKTDNDELFVVTDLVDCESLRSLLQVETFLSETAALEIFMQVAEALEYAHDASLTHGNLRPENIYISKTADGPDIVKVSDFGLEVNRKLLKRKVSCSQFAGLVGNPHYLSPEQCSGSSGNEAATDIYALGCIMFETLYGSPPFADRDPLRVMLKHLSATPTFLVDANVSHAMQRIILGCLQKRASQRYSCADLIRDLKRVRDGKPIVGCDRKFKLIRIFRPIFILTKSKVSAFWAFLCQFYARTILCRDNRQGA